MGGAIALLLGTLVWIYQHDRIDTEIIDRATHSVRLMNEEVRLYLRESGSPDIAGLKRQLEAFSAHVLHSRSGRFVAVRIYSVDHKLLAAVTVPAYRRLEDRKAFPGGDDVSAEKLESMQIKSDRLAGRPHLQFMAPLSDARGQPVAYIFADYALSKNAVSGIRRNTARAVLAVFGIVIATTGLLYPVIVTLLRKLAASSRDLLNSHLEALKLLGSAISKRDHGTDLHNYRVTIIAVYLAEACGLPSTEMHGLIKGAFLHDVGKLAVPDHILLKQGGLSAEEFSIMQKHVVHGMDIVRRSKWLADALPVVGYHHEKFDGQGYCHHLKGRAIPLAARIFAVADVFDALTSERQYKKAFTLERTMAMMTAERGRHFDPAVLDRFTPISGKLHKLLLDKGPAELQSALQAIINTYFAPEEAVDDALKTLAPGKHPPSHSSEYSSDIT